MFPPRTCYKSIILLATCAVLAHCVLESTMGKAAATAEQFADAAADKNGDETLTLHKRPSFFVGSRYGRSNGGAVLASSKIRRLNVAPRNDRFFLGSRYGKRAESNYNNNAELFATSPYEQQQQQQQQQEDDDVINAIDDALQPAQLVSNKQRYDASGAHDNMQQQQQQQQQRTPYMMSCVYTGLRNYYRCRNIEEINNIINQLTTAHSVEDKK